MSDLIPWMAPYTGWGVMLAVAIVGLAIARRGRGGRWPDGAPHCLQCEYDLTGIASASCPECGRPVDDDKRLYRRRRRWSLLLLGLAVAIALPTFAVTRRVNEYG